MNQSLLQKIINEGLYDKENINKSIADISYEFGYCIPTKAGNLYIDESLKSNINVIKKIISRYRVSIPNQHFRIEFVPKNVVFSLFNSHVTVKNTKGNIAKSEHSFSNAESAFISLFERAILNNANDIHVSIDLNKPNASVYFRVFGIVDRTPILIETNTVIAMIGSIFEWSGAEQSDKQFSLEANNATSFDLLLCRDTPEEMSLEVRAEYRSMTKKTKACVLRLISSASQSVSSEIKNITDAQRAVFSRFMRQGQGLILVSGPTGSGKSTLLNQIIKLKLYSAVLHTFENPIEAKHDDPLIFQGLISENIQEDISRCMRYDIDIAVVGEMRLGKEFEAAMTLARTGHLILSTIHAIDAVSILTRLMNMGINHDELSENNLLRLLTGQRLLPTLCPHCCASLKEKNFPFDRLFSVVSDKARDILYKNKDNLRFKNAQGCPECNQRGIVGRHMVLEQVVVDEVVRTCIKKNEINELKPRLKHNGWRSMSDYAWPLVSDGLIDPFDADNQIPEMFIESDAWRYE